MQRQGTNQNQWNRKRQSRTHPDTRSASIFTSSSPLPQPDTLRSSSGHPQGSRHRAFEPPRSYLPSPLFSLYPTPVLSGSQIQADIGNSQRRSLLARTYLCTFTLIVPLVFFQAIDGPVCLRLVQQKKRMSGSQPQDDASLQLQLDAASQQEDHFKAPSQSDPQSKLLVFGINLVRLTLTHPHPLVSFRNQALRHKSHRGPSRSRRDGRLSQAGSRKLYDQRYLIRSWPRPHTQHLPNITTIISAPDPSTSAL